MTGATGLADDLALALELADIADEITRAQLLGVGASLRLDD